MEPNNINELEDRVQNTILGKDSFEEVEKVLQEHIQHHELEKGTTTLVSLHILLAELLLMNEKALDAEKQFTKALEYDTNSIEAVIGVADSYIMQNKILEAEHLLNRLLDRFFNEQEWQAYLVVLDKIAFLAIEKQDELTVTRMEQRMCDTIALLKEIDINKVPLTSAISLIADDRGQCVIPYLESVIRHIDIEQERGTAMVVLKYAVQCYMQVGMSDKQIVSKLLALAQKTYEGYESMINHALKSKCCGA